jgi:uncharacterized SAM-binding protein YcdF (DUF218 family)
MFLKKAISYVLLPLPLILIVTVVGVLVLWFSSRQRTGKILVTVGASLLLLLSSGLTSGWLLSPLHHFKPLTDLTQAAGARWIVVLGSGFSTSPDAPATGRLSDSTLERLIEGIRLYRALPGAKLILSGGVEFDVVPQAEVLADAAALLGVPRKDLVLESKSVDTQDEAVLIRDIVGKDPFVLVTSIPHMRRSMLLFEKQGMTPIPAPAGFWFDHPGYWPSSGQLGMIGEADHEYFGLLWSRLRGTI